jgi:hypothetical protein
MPIGKVLAVGKGNSTSATLSLVATRGKSEKVRACLITTSQGLAGCQARQNFFRVEWVSAELVFPEYFSSKNIV